jgi:hypothetical protein
MLGGIAAIRSSAISATSFPSTPCSHPPPGADYEKRADDPVERDKNLVERRHFGFPPIDQASEDEAEGPHRDEWSKAPLKKTWLLLPHRRHWG